MDEDENEKIYEAETVVLLLIGTFSLLTLALLLGFVIGMNF